MLVKPQRSSAELQKELAENKNRIAEHKRIQAERQKKLAGYKNELATLEQAYEQDNFQLFVVCGPEGAGKTMLVEEFCGWKRRIFFKATGNDTETFKNFISRVEGHYDKTSAKPLTTWDSVFKFIVENEQDKKHLDKRLVLILDEFPDPAKHDDQFMTMFKDAIENYLSKTKMFLIVINSDIEFAYKYFLNENALLRPIVSGSIRLEDSALDEAEADKMIDDAVKNVKGITNANAKIQRFAADEIIIREGEMNDSIYKIISGSAVCWFKYDTDNEYVLASMTDGECFGEYSVLTGNTSIYTVVAFSDILAIKITKDDLASFLSENIKSALDIMKNEALMLDLMATNINILMNE